MRNETIILIKKVFIGKCPSGSLINRFIKYLNILPKPPPKKTIKTDFIYFPKYFIKNKIKIATTNPIKILNAPL